MTENGVNRQSKGYIPYIVKGCPCLMEFGIEQVCVNNDNVIPVYHMDVPMEIAYDCINGAEEAEKSTFQNDLKICYGLVDLGRADGIAYCAFHQVPLKINGIPIRSADIEDAIQFSLISENDQVCSSCIYKYLVTMGGIFEEEISPIEANKIIEGYITQIKTQFDGASDIPLQETGSAYRSVLRTHLRELIKEKNAWGRLVSERALSDTAEQKIHDLLETYKNTSRMEMILHHQLLSLYEQENGPKVQPKRIIKTAEQLMSLCKKIQETTSLLLPNIAVPRETEITIREHMGKRSRIENGIRMLLSTIGDRKSHFGQSMRNVD